MIPSLVALASYLTGRDRARAKPEQADSSVPAELQPAPFGELLRAWVEQASVQEVSCAVHFTADRQGDELHVGVRIVIPLRTQAAA